MKLKQLLVLLAFLMGLILAGFSYLAYSALGNLGDSLKVNSQSAQKYAQILNDTRAAQVAFQIQVQEWKNILIRGNNPDDYNRYFKGFEKQEKAMQETLTKVRPDMIALKMETKVVDTLLEEHKQLGFRYRQALNTWDGADEQTGKSVDKLLRGIDRPTSQALTELSNYIETQATEALSKTNEQAQAQAARSLTQFTYIAVGSFAFALLICLYIGLTVLRQVGAEPIELMRSFGQIAAGDLTKTINVREGDEKSIAASAAMMQMRMRSMIRAIHNGSEELDKTTSETTLASTTEQVRESLRNAKRSIKVLVEATARFKI